MRNNKANDTSKTIINNINEKWNAKLTNHKIVFKFTDTNETNM